MAEKRIKMAQRKHLKKRQKKLQAGRKSLKVRKEVRHQERPVRDPVPQQPRASQRACLPSQGIPPLLSGDT